MLLRLLCLKSGVRPANDVAVPNIVIIAAKAKVLKVFIIVSSLLTSAFRFRNAFGTLGVWFFIFDVAKIVAFTIAFRVNCPIQLGENTKVDRNSPIELKFEKHRPIWFPHFISRGIKRRNTLSLLTVVVVNLYGKDDNTTNKRNEIGAKHIIIITYETLYHKSKTAYRHHAETW